MSVAACYKLYYGVSIAIGPLHGDGGRGTVSARLAFQQTRNLSAGETSDHSRKVGMPGTQAQAHTHVILMYDNHTRVEL